MKSIFFSTLRYPLDALFDIVMSFCYVEGEYNENVSYNDNADFYVYRISSLNRFCDTNQKNETE